MPSILGTATKMIMVVTILLGIVYLAYFLFVGPLEPDPNAPTFADVQKRLEAGETTEWRSYTEAELRAIEERSRQIMEQQRKQ